jgi:hypothetical protein
MYRIIPSAILAVLFVGFIVLINLGANDETIFLIIGVSGALCCLVGIAVLLRRQCGSA